MALQGPLGFQPNIAGMRPSNADRSRAVDVLAAAFAEGRLDGAEHRRRVDAALQATSYQELSVLTGDLPSGPLPMPGQGPPMPVGYGPAEPYPYQRQLPLDGCGVASMVLGITTVFAWFLFGLPALGALVTGHIALARADRYSGTSRGMAVAGLVLGYLTLAISFVVVLLIALTS